ncbi:hypothetical protein GTW25_11235 [Aliihoeflea aestuarii]|jgi:hypothetical protein|uniref:hypothetical protein n=1 Tax=Aliihoeflea aestuarii TaxID=453840 RepID=UPI00209262D6|nr:hypothetical protein [Aliihoeflea aestuarii]MCO6391604.1 hypothetical protein [Aliihoeflea aestuarii]
MTTTAPEHDAGPNTIPVRRRLPVVAMAAVAVLLGLWLGILLVALFRGQVAGMTFEAASAGYTAMASIAFVAIAVAVDLIVARLWARAPLPGSGLWAAMRARWQGDRTEEEFARTVKVLLICLGLIGAIVLLAVAPFQVLLGMVIAFACLWAGDQVVTICRNARYRYFPSVTSALSSGAFIGLVIGYFGS